MRLLQEGKPCQHTFSTLTAIHLLKTGEGRGACKEVSPMSAPES